MTLTGMRSRLLFLSQKCVGLIVERVAYGVDGKLFETVGCTGVQVFAAN